VRVWEGKAGVERAAAEAGVEPGGDDLRQAVDVGLGEAEAALGH